MSLTLQPDRASHPAKPEEPTVSATITDEQFAARELVRSWAAGSGAADTVRDIEDGQADAWRSVYDGVAELGLFGVAVDEAVGGAGGSVIDLCAMVEEAAIMDSLRILEEMEAQDRMDRMGVLLTNILEVPPEPVDLVEAALDLEVLSLLQVVPL